MMLIKHKKTKEYRAKLSVELIALMEETKDLANNAGYELDIDSSIEKHLQHELAKVRKQISNEHNSIKD